MDAIEVTTFKLTSGLTIDDFVAANADVDAWLLKQPGFISRRIVQRGDGVVIDLLIWARVRDGETAAARLMDGLAASPVHAAIDRSKASFTVSAVQHRLLPSTTQT
ncbi:hypothetical protein [Caulobacter sp. 602-1]|uniref:hypothetical protein n=1 Tax=Caulobacter sp. 602-1 TaxID=2492472 RepID=UPI000F630434|nr:hypothetical protein [Caulobacter sp. 602-1]RRN63880.1 hypothetical protein EIK80_14020 [Caulobacter sp. 602-1]